MKKKIIAAAVAIGVLTGFLIWKTVKCNRVINNPLESR